MKRRILLPAAVVLVLCPFGLVHAGLNAYMLATGEQQGQIKGGVTQAGKVDQMQVVQSSHEIVSPRDAASGLPTGKRQHKPFTITKPVDKATPLLLKAMVTNETLTQVVINYWRPTLGGAEQLAFSVTLTGAKIVNHTIRQLPTYEAANTSVPELEEIQFVYEKITWTWTSPNLTATDSWTIDRVQ